MSANRTGRSVQPRADAIRARIVAAGLTQTRCAQLLNISEGTIRDVLAGRPCSRWVARRILKMFKATVSELFDVVALDSLNGETPEVRELRHSWARRRRK